MKIHFTSGKAQFVWLFVLAVFLSWIPFVHLPFSWMMTYFHEISHGLAALLTGGSILRIELNLNGSGTCTTAGGWRFFILNAGYIGAIISGIILFEMADEISHRNTRRLAIGLAIMFGVTALLYGRDMVTWVILGVLCVLSLSVLKLQEARWMKVGLKFIGIYVLNDAIFAPLNLIDGRHKGDAAALADITFIPEILWVGLWFVLGIVGAYMMWRLSRHTRAR